MFRFKSLKLHHQILLVLLTVFILQSTILLIKDPPIWPDEAIYADIAKNWITDRRLGPDVWQDAYLGARQHFYSYPPTFLYLLTVWFKIFGFSIVNQRLLSLTISVAFAIVFFLFAKSFFKNNPLLFALLPLFTLTIDPFFSQSTRISRPEIVVIFFGTVSLLMLRIPSSPKTNLKVRGLAVICSGVFSSLAFLTHFIGGFFAFAIFIIFLIQERFKIFYSKKFYLYLLSFIFLPIVWGASILKDVETFKEQLFLFSGAVQEYYPFVYKNLFHGDPTSQILFIGYVSVSITFVAYALLIRNINHLILATLITVSWLVVTYGKEVWYFVYVTPFIYLAASVLLYELLRAKVKKSDLRHLTCEVSTASFIIVFMLNIFFNFNLISHSAGDKYSYKLFVENILDKVPDNKTVFLSSIPDPYYGFKIRNPESKIYEFPVVRIKKEKFLKLLNDSDYIISNGIYNDLMPDLPQYISMNSAQISEIGGNNQYWAQIIELKPLNQRQMP